MTWHRSKKCPKCDQTVAVSLGGKVPRHTLLLVPGVGIVVCPGEQSSENEPSA